MGSLPPARVAFVHIHACARTCVLRALAAASTFARLCHCHRTVHLICRVWTDDRAFHCTGIMWHSCSARLTYARNAAAITFNALTACYQHGLSPRLSPALRSCRARFACHLYLYAPAAFWFTCATTTFPVPLDTQPPAVFSYLVSCHQYRARASYRIASLCPAAAALHTFLPTTVLPFTAMNFCAFMLWFRFGWFFICRAAV